MSDSAEARTGALFSSLFRAYDDEAYLQSVALFRRRFEAAGFDLSWFRGKRCLDVGCGGGRYSVALAQLESAETIGVDLDAELLADAERRAKRLVPSARIGFQRASASNLPFDAGAFDFVCCSGVLQHTARPVATLQEISRVLKPGGRVYMLVYATEGVRWPLVQMLRPLAQRIGFVAIDAAITADGIPVNKRRTYLDDLFVPYIDFYSWPALHDLLMAAEFEHVERWVAARFDQEEDLTCRISSDQWLLENSAERTG